MIGLRYATSVDGGASWSQPGDVIRELNASNFALGASAQGRGLVAWSTSGSDDGTIKAARLTPLIPGGGLGPQPPTPVGDRTAPTISAFSMTKRRFKASRKPRTAFRYRLSEQAPS